ncbi:hypothetical protein GGR26_001022 [Lewinella marina]|uniref:hypothetical protein n=1 Tax=Neolewinella marina TaxID=438751 RepID=UPI0011798E99|nr:hypothetical protein [Neolewinella marina]NJB85277.1 hypothetical protein [Neolewinella marina]
MYPSPGNEVEIKAKQKGLTFLFLSSLNNKQFVYLRYKPSIMQRTTPSFTTAHMLQRLSGNSSTHSLIRFASDRQASLDKLSGGGMAAKP